MSKMLRPAWVIPLIFLLQLVPILGLELAHDEAYYWLFSRHLDWGYFDHPPMVALTIRMFSWLPHGELAVRVGFLLQQLGALWIVLKLVPKEKTHPALFLFCAIPLAYLSGILALPDMPLLFLTAVYCYFLRGYLEKDDVFHALALAVTIPLLLYAKYHGILLIFFTIVAVPSLLKRKSFYLITGISLLLFSPHLFWQLRHDFPTLKYHFLERPKANFSVKRLLEFTATQIFLPGLLAGPIVWWAVIKHRSGNSFERAMKFIAIGVPLFFFVSTFSKKYEANWTIHTSVSFIVLAALSPLWSRKVLRSLLVASAVLVVLSPLVLTLGPWAPKRIKEFRGWESFAKVAQQTCGDLPILANSYQIASKLSFYLLREIPALNLHSRKNQFDLWKWDHALSGTVCYLTDKSDFLGPEIPTPDGKSLKVIREFSMDQLRNKKGL